MNDPVIRTIARHIFSLGGAALLGGIAVGIAFGVALDELRDALLGIAAMTLIALVALAATALLRASRKTDQIFDEELDRPADTNNTGETR